MVCHSAEFLWIHAEFPRHLDLRMRQLEARSGMNPGLVFFAAPFG
jgi:hypothetical protein